jgi:hypothetical protein
VPIYKVTRATLIDWRPLKKMSRARILVVLTTNEPFCSILTHIADKFDFYGIAIFSDVEIGLFSCYVKLTMYAEQSQRHRGNTKKLSGGV